MNVAVVIPSPAPFAFGGAESLAWSLAETINEGSSHQAELLKLPFREQSFAGVMEGYQAFSQLDLSHFDMVISTKYPSWMVRHENHVCYMLHCLRGLYDTYHMSGQPLEYMSDHDGVRGLQQFMEQNREEREALPELFERVNQLMQPGAAPEDAFAFPGPLTRQIMHFLDGIGLSQKAVQRYTAISANVAGRPYYPQGAQVDVIYPPSMLKNFRCRSYDYLFTVSRLDHPKRIDLLIKGMASAKADVQLRIAGTGPQEAALRELAEGDPRVSFVGFVNNEQLLDLYADAMGVLFAPYDEDLGYITIEAMKSGKPVITTTDAGGPNEFVADGETGFSVAPEPEAIGVAIDKLAADPARCRSMGAEARRRMAPITWPNVVRDLLGEPGAGAAARRRIAAALTYPVWPPMGGGQNRVFHLYKNLAKEYDVTLVCLVNHDQERTDRMIAPNIREICVPKSEAHMLVEWKEYQDHVDAPVTDAAFPLAIHLTPDYVETFRAAAGQADVCVVDHPYSWSLVSSEWKGQLWHNSHNVELDLKKALYKPGPVADALLAAVQEAESASCRESSVVMVCSGEDRDRLAELYGADPDRMVVVPNGVDASAIPFAGLEERKQLKAKMGEADVFSVLFMGSWHGPNLEACDFLLELAKELPDVRFLFMGSCCNYYCDCKLPGNVFELGVLDNAQKEVALSLADAAVNPVVSGSGTNLKLLEYLAAGLPTVSTPFGARGLGLIPDEHVLLAELEDFPAALQRLRNETEDETARRILAARQEVERRFDWAVVAGQFLQEAKAKSLIS